jgi:chromosome partitioning protein
MQLAAPPWVIARSTRSNRWNWGASRTTTASPGSSSRSAASKAATTICAPASTLAWAMASSAVGYPRAKIELTVYDAMIGEVALKDVIRPTEITSLFVAPATMDLVGAELELISAEGREGYLRRLLATVADDYDYVIVDCPPSLSLLTLNALVAADGVVVPMQAEYFALEGLSALLTTIERVKASFNPRLELAGILFCMYDPRTNLSGQVRG